MLPRLYLNFNHLLDKERLLKYILVYHIEAITILFITILINQKAIEILAI